LVLLALVLSLVAIEVARRSRAGGDIVSHPETGYQFPTPLDIAGMRIERFEFLDDGTITEDYEVPRALWSEVVAALSPSEREPSPRKWALLGEVRVVLKDSSTLWIDVYYVPGQKTGRFSVRNGRDGSVVYYRGGSSTSLADVLREIRQENRGREKGDKSNGD
jgi:hypothetical protein